MQKSKVFVVLLLALTTSGACWAQSTGHSGHSGGGSAGSQDCTKAKVSRFKPEHMASVAPGAEFSFAASGSNGPGHIHVSIKQRPIEVTMEDKDTFYLVKGKLPEDIKNTTVRISVAVKSKVSRCNTQGGWLLKVTE